MIKFDPLPLAGIIAVVAILFAAGMTKGVIGIGLPRRGSTAGRQMAQE
jgi:hypothetical protein